MLDLIYHFCPTTYLNCILQNGLEDILHKGLMKQIYKEGVSIFENALENVLCRSEKMVKEAKV